MGSPEAATDPHMLDREALSAWYVRNRERSEALFDRVRPEAYESRPIALRNPICFYEGHLPAFSVNTLLKRGLGDAALDSDYEILFERGIDPESADGAPPVASPWPSRIDIRSYGAKADRAVLDALARRDIAAPDNPVLAKGLAVYTVLEHEPMHQETLRYMWHRLPFDRKRRPRDLAAPWIGGEPPARREVPIPEGTATLGARPEERFAWDNERPGHTVEVAAFSIDVHSVTNRDYLEFVESDGYQDEVLWDPDGWEWRSAGNVRHPLFWELHRGLWFWRGMWDLIPLPMAWPVYVSHAEASAYARWRKRRLPTEAEYHRAAFGAPDGVERRHPWGDAPPDATRGNFDFANWDPVPAGSFPRGASAWGVHDLVGNGWEWTSTVFAGFEGFRPMPSYPQYSADFFDGKHHVMKGASPATAKELVRPSFRNWFRGTYPYVYAKFRTAA
jgi:ergothioneine biosynthesis protein EgtB